MTDYHTQGDSAPSAPSEVMDHGATFVDPKDVKITTMGSDLGKGIPQATEVEQEEPDIFSFFGREWPSAPPLFDPVTVRAPEPPSRDLYYGYGMSYYRTQEETMAAYGKYEVDLESGEHVKGQEAKPAPKKSETIEREEEEEEEKKGKQLLTDEDKANPIRLCIKVLSLVACCPVLFAYTCLCDCFWLEPTAKMIDMCCCVPLGWLLDLLSYVFKIAGHVFMNLVGRPLYKLSVVLYRFLVTYLLVPLLQFVCIPIFAFYCKVMIPFFKYVLEPMVLAIVWCVTVSFNGIAWCFDNFCDMLNHLDKNCCTPCMQGMDDATKCIYDSVFVPIYTYLIAPIGAGITAVASAFYNYIMIPMYTAMAAVGNFIYTYIMTPIGTAIVAVTSALSTYILTPIFDGIAAVIEAIGNMLKSLFELLGLRESD